MWYSMCYQVCYEMFGYFLAFGWALLRRCLGYLFVIVCGIFCVCDLFAWVFFCFFCFSLGGLLHQLRCCLCDFFVAALLSVRRCLGHLFHFCLCQFFADACVFSWFFWSFLAWFPWLFGWALCVFFCNFFVVALFIFFLLCCFVTVAVWLTFSFFH